MNFVTIILIITMKVDMDNIKIKGADWTNTLHLSEHVALGPLSLLIPSVGYFGSDGSTNLDSNYFADATDNSYFKFMHIITEVKQPMTKNSLWQEHQKDISNRIWM